MSSGERAIRHGELRQLKEMKRAQKFEAPRKRKLLKSDPWGLEDNEEEDNQVDMRDVDFRLSHDSSKINVSKCNLLNSNTDLHEKTLLKKKIEFSVWSHCLQLPRSYDIKVNPC